MNKYVFDTLSLKQLTVMTHYYKLLSCFITQVCFAHIWYVSNLHVCPMYIKVNNSELLLFL
jgi:hypothetical protein